MPVTETHRALGQWLVQLSASTPRSVLEALTYLGHVVVLTGRVEPALIGDGLLSSSEHTGVLRGLSLGEDGYTLTGVGMAFWLGDEEDKGSVYETPLTFTAETPTQTIRDLLPASGAVTEGTFHTVVGTYTGSHQWQSPRTAIDYVASTVGAEWRVNGDGTLDFGTTEDLFVTDPNCLVIRRGAGVDDMYRALQGSIHTSSDVEDFTTRVVLLAQGTEAATLTATADLSPGLNPYKDVHGNPVQLTRMVSESTTDASNADARAQLQLNRFSGTRDAMRLTAGDYDVFGAARAGDYVYVFDPDVGMFDLDNEITFRGERLYPAKLRLTEVTWPIRPGRTVAYRAPNGTWVDLTDYVVWESGDATLVVGSYSRSLLTSGEVVGTRPVADTSVPGAPTWIEPFRQGVYQSPTSGVSRGSSILAWTQPANTDSSPIIDGSHYEIRYRTTSVPVYPTTWDQFEALYSDWDDVEAAGVTWDNLVDYDEGEWQHATAGFDTTTFRLQELVPAHPYEAQIRAVDMATPPNVSAWSASAFFQTTSDDIPPATPAPPTIAASVLAVQMTHNLGVSGGGTFNLDRDLHHLELHGGTEHSFTPDESTRLGKVIANWGMLITEVPAVATFPLDSLVPVYFKVVAVDESGNKSLPSVAVSATADLVDDAHITSLTASKITAGEITADIFVGADITGGALHVIGDAGIDVTGGGNVQIHDGALIIYNASGNKIVELGECADGRHGLQVYKDNGTRVARIGELESGSEGIELINTLGALVRVDTLAFGMRGATVAAFENTSSTSFTNLATVGPSVTVTLGTSARCIVIVSTSVTSDLGGSNAFMGFEYSGPGGTAPAAELSSLALFSSAFAGISASKVFNVDPIAPAGDWTFTAKYKCGPGDTVQFGNRHIVVLPY